MTTPPPVIGLVGSVGAGKSAAATILKDRGLLVYDADAESRRVFELDDVQDEMKQWWGPSVVNEQGRVDRAAVGRIVFTDKIQRDRLEQLIHPQLAAAREQVRQYAALTRAPGVVIDAPLLFEVGLDTECDAILCIDAPFDTRAARVAQSRGWSPEELRRRDDAQIPIAEKRRRSTEIIDNEGDLSALREAVSEALDRILTSPHPTPDPR